MKSRSLNFRPLVAVLVIVAMCVMPIGAQNTYRDATSGFLKETTFLTSAARTTSGNSTTVLDVGPYANGNIWIDVTAASGTPSMVVDFASCSTTTVADCVAHTSTAAITGTGHTLMKVNNFGRYVLIIYTISGGTPSLTFTVKGTFKAVGS